MSLDAYRSALPIPDRPAPGLTTYDAKDPDTAYPPIEPLLPPEGAPNVLIVLLDDVGFGASSAFGGPCRTPNAERLAAGGLRYNRFHTTALCAPTRQALLTGRNHHSVGMGSITETATSAPGNSSLRPNTKAPLAMTLKLNGYSTAQFGKCHEVPVWQSSPMGPFDAWPSGGGGFETFYGFIGGENNQWDPALYDGTTPGRAAGDAGGGLPPHRGPRRPGRQLDPPAEGADARQAVLRLLRARAPPTRRTTCPRSGPTSTRASSTTAGTRSASARSPARRSWASSPPTPSSPPATPRSRPGTTCPTSSSRCSPAQMEVYAGFLEHTDHHVGRVIDAIEDLGILDDTIIYYIIGDNGASAEGTLNGAFNEMANFNGMAALETPGVPAVSKMDELGSPIVVQPLRGRLGVGDGHAVPVDQAGRLALGRHPQRDDRALAQRHRGARAACARSSPTSSTSRPTILEAAGLPEPTMVNGVQQSPMEGTSMLYTFNDADAAERHDLQYFEMFGNRGIYHRGWSAVTKHRTPWVMVGGDVPAFDDDVWELYDGSTDYSQAHDLAAEQPGRCSPSCSASGSSKPRSTTCCRSTTAARSASSPSLAGRPTLIRGTSQLFFAGMGRLSENSVVSIKNKSFSVTAEVEVPDGGADGVIIAQGGRFGGWAVYVKDGKAKFVYNVARHPRVRHRRPTNADPRRHPPGAHGVRLRRRRPGQGRRRHPLLRRRRRSGTGRVGATQPMIFSADETTDIGYEIRHDRHPRLHRRGPAGSPGRSTGCRSTSATTTTTTSSTPRNASASPWPGSRAGITRCT